MVHLPVVHILAFIAVLGRYSVAQEEKTWFNLQCWTCGKPGWIPGVSKPPYCQTVHSEFYEDDGGFCAEVYQISTEAGKERSMHVFSGYLENDRLEGVGIGDRQCGRFLTSDWVQDPSFRELGIADLCTCNKNLCNMQINYFEALKTRCYVCLRAAGSANKSDENFMALIRGEYAGFDDRVELEDCSEGKGQIFTRTADSSCAKITMGGKVMLRGHTRRGIHKRVEVCTTIPAGTEVDFNGQTFAFDEDVRQCYCNGDLCNGSSGVVGSSLLSLAVLVAALARALAAIQAF